MAEKKMTAPTRTSKEDELNVAVWSTPSTLQDALASQQGSSTHSPADTMTDYSPQGDWKEVVSKKKAKKKLSMSPRKPTPPTKKKEESSMGLGRKTPSPPPKKQRVRSPLLDPGREKLIAWKGREYPLHEKYGLDEVVTDQLPDKTRYIIISTYRQLRQEEKKFNVDLPAYFLHFLGAPTWYLAKGPTSKYSLENNYNDIEGRFKRAIPVDNSLHWFGPLQLGLWSGSCGHREDNLYLPFLLATP